MTLSGVLAGVLQQQSAGGGAFNPETDIAWHSFFWAEGTAFQALGYSDGATLTNWPNETSEKDADIITLTPTYDAAHAKFNNQPVVAGAGNEAASTDAFTSSPDYSNGITIVCISNLDSISGNRFFFDGITSTDRNAMFHASGGSEWAIFAGASLTPAVPGTNTDANFLRGFFDDTANEEMWLNETSIVSGDGGSQTLTGITLMNHNGLGSLGQNGKSALYGIYEGDLAADGSFADFKTWITDHYGIALA